MLNKPKFMSPSINMQGGSVIDLNSDNLPFSCIVDGNEAISAWRIKVYTLNDNAIILDTGKQILDQPFYPVDSKNRNVIFKINLTEYLNTENDIYYSATSIYDPNKSYFTRSGTVGNYKYTLYTYDESTWASKYKTLFYLSSFLNIDSPYYWMVEFWSTNEIENNLATTISCEEVFYANSTPLISLQYGKEIVLDDGSTFIEYIDCPDNNDDIILDSRKYYFKAIYNQNESVPIKKYGWRITDIDSGVILVDTITHNQIYGVVDNIVCLYEGFLSDVTYSVEVFIETQNGVSVITSPKTFKVLYTTTYLTNDFKTELLKKEPAIILDWSNSVVIGGHAEGEISYKSNYPIVNYSADTSNTSVEIPSGSYVVYDYGSSSNLDISEKSYITISTQLKSGTGTVLFIAEGQDEDGYEATRKLSFSEGSFIYSVLGNEDIVLTKTYTPIYQPNEYVWYVITMSPILIDENEEYYIEFKVNESVAEEGLYPSEDLYPSNDLYPNFGTWELKVEGGA